MFSGPPAHAATVVEVLAAVDKLVVLIVEASTLVVVFGATDFGRHRSPTRLRFK